MSPPNHPSSGFFWSIKWALIGLRKFWKLAVASRGSSKPSTFQSGTFWKDEQRHERQSATGYYRETAEDRASDHYSDVETSYSDKGPNKDGSSFKGRSIRPNSQYDNCISHSSDRELSGSMGVFLQTIQHASGF